MKNYKNDFRTHKTSTKNRKTYIYYGPDNEKFELMPGENGVTEMWIKYLHAQDDSEVYNNNKNGGYEIENKNYDPEDPYSTKKVRIWTKYFEYSSDENEIAQDKSNDEFLASRSNKYGKSETAVLKTCIEEIAKDYLTKKQQTIICLMYEGYKATEIAKILNVSDAAISKQKDKIKAVFVEHFLNN